MNIKDIFYILKFIEDGSNFSIVISLLDKEDIPEDVNERVYEIILKERSTSLKLLKINNKNIKKDIRRRAELKCLESPQYAYYLRKYIYDLPEDIKRRAELKCCEDPHWAYSLRRVIKDLQEDVKRRAEEKVCESPQWAYYLRRDVKDLPEHIKIFAEEKARMGI